MLQCIVTVINRRDIRIGILVNNYWSPFDRYDAAMDVTYEQMELFSIDIMKQFCLKVLIQGNIDKSSALSVVENMVKTLNFEPLPPTVYPRVSMKKIHHQFVTCGPV